MFRLTSEGGNIHCSTLSLCHNHPSLRREEKKQHSQALLMCYNYNTNNFSEHTKPEAFEKPTDSVTLEITASLDQYREPLCYLSHRKTLLCSTINPAWNSLCWKKRKSAWWKTKTNQKHPKDSWLQGKRRHGCSISRQEKELSMVGKGGEK